MATGNTGTSARAADAPRRLLTWCRARITPGMLAIIGAPILSLVCWGAFTWAKYGAVHFLNMSAFQRGQAHSLDFGMLTAGILGAMGLGVVPLGLLGFLIKPATPSLWGKVLALCGGGCAAGLAVLMRYGALSVLLFALSVSISLYTLGLIVRLGWQSARTRDWTLLPLVVWILAGLAFQYGLMFSAVRYVLFLAPPIILLALRMSSWVPRQGGLTAMLGANLLFVAALGFADARQASVYPAIVTDQIRPATGDVGRQALLRWPLGPSVLCHANRRRAVR